MKKPTPIEPMFLRVSAAAIALNMSPASVYELIKKGILPAGKIGGKTRIPVLALRRLQQEMIKLQQQMVQAVAADTNEPAAD
jgi:excisionase family DNA binding protein